MAFYSQHRKPYEATVFESGAYIVAVDGKGGTIAAGDAWVDDPIVIQAALTYVGSIGGGTVFISAGVYNISITLNIPTFTNMVGEGGGTYLYASNGLDDNVITISDKRGITISDVWIDGNGAGQAVGNGIGITHTVPTSAIVRIHDVFIYGCKDYGVYISENSNYVNIYDCNVVQSSSGQIYDLSTTSNIHDVYGYTPIGRIRENISGLLEITGDARALIPCTDTTGTTLTDFSGMGHNGVSALDVRYTLDYMGKAYVHNLNPASPAMYLYIPHNDDFSFGDSSKDQAFSLFVVFRRVGTVHSACNLISKRDDTLGRNEWWVEIGSGSPSKMTFECFDESVDKYIKVVSSDIDWNSPPTNSWNVMMATYDGSSSESGLNIYLNGVNVSDSRSNNGAYVAMENLAGDVGLGCCFDNGAVSSIHYGPVTWFGITGKELNSTEVWSATQLLKGVLGV